MPRLVPALSLTLLSALALGCAGDQAYTPINVDQEDTLCRQSTVRLNETSAAAIEFNDDGSANHEGEVEVTLFTETEMRVDTEEVIFSVPGGKIVTVNVGEGSWDFFTDMVFSVDVREAGSSAWDEMSISTNAYDIVWFNSIELNGGNNDLALSTYALCSTRKQDAAGLEFPFDVSKDYEMRIRAYPFNGAGDLVGSYKYNLEVALF